MSRPKIHHRGQSKAEIDFLARPAKELILPAVTSCEVHQDKAILVFRPDGSGTLTCTTGNRDPHRSAIWYTDFSIQDTAGATLFGIGPFFSQSMPPHGSTDAFRQTWVRDFDFPAAFFAEIASASQNYGCFSSLPAPTFRANPNRSSAPGRGTDHLLDNLAERSRAIFPAFGLSSLGALTAS